MGDLLAGGVDYRCRFGSPNATVPASLGDDGALRCTAPESDAVGHQAVEITVNGRRRLVQTSAIPGLRTHVIR